MNLVDMLKDQMMGATGKKIGSMIGASESDLSKILGAGLPSVLSGMGAMASNKSGADKLAKTIGGMDPSVFGDLGKMLGSGAMNNGGSMLGGLMGSGVVDGIATVVAKFTGINVSIVKTALGYLAPIILGTVGASFKGGKPDGAGISRLFSEQKSNIAAAMPAGLSLDAIPGLNALSSSVANVGNQAVSEVGNGLGKLLVPGAVIAALVAAGIFIANNGKKGVDAVKDKAVDMNMSKPATNAMEETGNVVNKATEASTEVVKTSINGMMDGLLGSLGAIQDAAGAETAMPALKEMVSKVDGLGLSISALPDPQRTQMGGLIKTQLEKLSPLIEKISALPGVGDAIKTLLIQLKDKLTSFTS